jgi:CheY-like chemotaxis protein
VANGMLRSLGVEVETAVDGREALAILRIQRVDLVLMDCEMPVMDGFAATRTWRRDEPAGCHLPVVALTADATNTGRAACLSAGMDDYLAKPFSREALHAVLSHWLPAAVQELELEVEIASQQPNSVVRMPTSEPPATPAREEVLLDQNTLNALRVASQRGAKDLLGRVAERYLSDSGSLIASIERAIQAGDAVELARAAHAWRSYNGNVGAHALARLCRELENRGREGNLTGTGELLTQLHALRGRVRTALQEEIRRSA